MSAILTRRLLVFAAATVILLFVYYLILLLGGQKLKIVSMSPKDGSTNQSLFSSPSVSFSRSLMADEKSKVSLTVNPKIVDSSWVQDGKTIAISPQQPLETSTLYTVTLNFESKAYTWSFKTVDENHISDSDRALLQGSSDQKAREDLKNFYQKNPWYEKIPITTDSYFVGFDSDKNGFFAYLYPTGSSSVSLDDQVASLKAEVIGVLKKIGASPDPNTIEWVVSPKQATPEP